MAKREVIVVLGNQLIPDNPALRKHPDATIVMIEADDICRQHRYHKHKLMLVLGAMRHYANALKRDVDYTEYQPKSVYKTALEMKLKQLQATDLIWMHASDKGPNRMLDEIAKASGYRSVTYPNKQFLTTTADFGGWLESQTAKTPLMETFYRWQRKRLDILMEAGKPVGGSWNYDAQNRKPLPKKMPPVPPLPEVRMGSDLKGVAQVVDKHFSHNPGSTEDFWLPTTRTGALTWLDSFVRDRLNDFGPYEDAMKHDEPFLYHSVLSPLINIGLLTPDECVSAAVDAYRSSRASLQSTEGFVRQIIGWREFMYGLYWWRCEDFDDNYFGFSKQLEEWWYTNTDVPSDVPTPVRVCLDRVHRYGYSHHIERLMVFGNWFLLNGYDPRSVYDWFSGLYVDAYEWVMVPNVLGMSQYADGGMLATKPYVSGGNYLQKMGGWWDSPTDAKDSVFTEKYWEFIYEHRAKFIQNHRMSLIVAQALKRYEK